MRTLRRPLFIGIAGIQGSGKSTQTKVLQSYLESQFGMTTCALSIDDFYKDQTQRNTLRDGIQTGVIPYKFEGLEGSTELPQITPHPRDGRDTSSGKEVYFYTDYENDMRNRGDSEADIEAALKENRDYNMNTHNTHTPTAEGLEQNYKVKGGRNYLDINGGS